MSQGSKDRAWQVALGWHLFEGISGGELRICSPGFKLTACFPVTWIKTWKAGLATGHLPLNWSLWANEEYSLEAETKVGRDPAEVGVRGSAELTGTKPQFPVPVSLCSRLAGPGCHQHRGCPRVQMQCEEDPILWPGWTGAWGLSVTGSLL